MLPAAILLLAALGLLVCGAVKRLPPAVPGAVGTAVALAVLAWGTGSGGFGFGVRVDGVAAVPLLAVFLLAGCGGVRPVRAGVAALVLLAAEGAGLVVAAAVLGGLGAGEDVAGRRAPWAAGVVVALGVAVLAVGPGWPGGLGTLAAVAGATPGPWAGVLLVGGTVAGWAVLAGVVPWLGGIVGVYAVGRLLLDLPGGGVPGWWGVPVLGTGAVLAAWGAQRAAGAGTLRDGLAALGLVGQGVAGMALGVALAARGMDALPVASLAAGAGWLVLLAGGWGGALACLADGRVEAGAGIGLERAGGVLRQAPATGLGLLAGLGVLGWVPLLPGFAGLWLVLEAVVGVGRSGGPGVLLAVAGAVAGLGLVTGLSALAAARMAGLVLFGPARGRGMVESGAAGRLVLMALAGGAVALGVVPGLGLWLVRDGAASLAGALDGAGWFAVGMPEVPGYAAPAVAVLVGVPAVAAWWMGRNGERRVVAWDGGLGQGASGAPIDPLSLAWPELRVRPGAVLMAVLLALLAGLLGWAAR